MTKKRNRKKNMEEDASVDNSESKSFFQAPPQAMDTTETGDSRLAARARTLTSTRKGKPMKRTKKAGKMNAVAIAMDTTETGDSKLAPKLAPLSTNLTSKRKGIPMKRTKNVRKMKAQAKAIALSEKYEEKATKNQTKTLKTLSAKKLYE
ncbi:PREDICTED: uncharacterized protein LOC104717499 [Camelina sativa]|uniref:Uncharacterized protein LOC104717499 n=1 Tax=Camelina sativa TaxID=90675 RepID=A0ABM0TYT3_CAMSA|nr:PREDICTED: uncharacterized protein LOC104717499 [Camelina sativa]